MQDCLPLCANALLSCRNVVIALLRTKGPGTAIRKVDINEACKIKLGIEVPQPVYNKVRTV